MLFLQTNWWVSDEQFGFCRIDVNPVTGATSLSHCFQADATFFPGQTAAAAPNALGQQIVYVPDSSGFTSNVYRFIFTPDGTGGTITPTEFSAVRASGRAPKLRPWPCLWVRSTMELSTSVILTAEPFIKSPTRQPRLAPPSRRGKLFNSTGVISMAFQGNDLYLSELGPPPIDGQFIKKGVVTVIYKASPSANNGGATPVKRAIARLQTPQIIVENPGGFTMGPTGGRPGCLPPSGRKAFPQRSGRSRQLPRPFTWVPWD